MINKQRERLVELLKETRCERSCDGFKNIEVCNGCTAYERYAESADHILADGWMRPPCKVGDFIFAKYSATNEIECYVIDKVIHNGSNSFSFEAHLENEDGYVVDILEFDNVYIGITVFLTKEEAEEALKGGV